VLDNRAIAGRERLACYLEIVQMLNHFLKKYCKTIRTSNVIEPLFQQALGWYSSPATYTRIITTHE
jgi:hypothetical protein